MLLEENHMEDNDTLLKTALHLHYCDRPTVVTDAMQIIKDYCNKQQTNSEYDEVLKILHGLMNDLPSNILLYFLTTVPLPRQKGSTTSTFSELMKKSRVSLLDNMQSVLIDYINKAMPPLISINIDNECNTKNMLENQKETEELPILNETNLFEQEPVQLSKVSQIVDPYSTCLSLLDICAEYVVVNIEKLQQLYCSENEKVWSIVNKNLCNVDEQMQCYKYIEDINKKLQWLRMIEAGHISVDVIKELYGNSEVFLKERNLFNLVDESTFTLSKEVKEAIENFIND